jgi:Holliday junction resolvase
MKYKKVIITKASEVQDKFSREKLQNSLRKASANEATVQSILKKIESTLYDGISTKEIYKIAFALLKKVAPSQASRYNLKRAIMALGPSGFPFEKYIAAIFEWQGYKVETQVFLNGACVTHEIDVLAKNDQHALLIECKYHSIQGKFSDVKVPLYIHSRYMDVLSKWVVQKPLQGWVVTNTKFSLDAEKYGTCAGLHLLSWNYPNKRSLSTLVDASALYPVTCLTTLTIKEKEWIMQKGVVLCKALLTSQELLQKINIPATRIEKIVKEISELCKVA